MKLCTAIFLMIGLAFSGCGGGDASTAEIKELEIKQRRCIDTLAGVHYADLLDVIPYEYGVGFFHYAFGGDVVALTEKELGKGRDHVRVNLTWADDHRYTSNDYDKIINAAAEYEELCRTYPNRVFLSGVTEHNLEEPQAEGILNLLLTYAPSCEAINSPLNGAFLYDVENEIHGNSVCPGGYRCSYSSDGTDSFLQDFESIKLVHKNATRLCAWHPSLNLKYVANEKTSREQRILEVEKRRPSVETVDRLVDLLNDKG